MAVLKACRRAEVIRQPAHDALVVVISPHAVRVEGKARQSRKARLPFKLAAPKHPVLVAQSTGCDRNIVGDVPFQIERADDLVAQGLAELISGRARYGQLIETLKPLT